MDLKDLVTKARTYRRFTSEKISNEILNEFVEIASHCPSARNQQPTRYILVNTEENIQLVDEAINLSGLNYEARKEFANMHPTAYIILCSQKSIGLFQTMDIGIIAQTIQLAAAEKNIGTCMIGAYNKVKVADSFPIIEDSNLDSYLILAFGYPDDTIEIVPADPSKNGYWRENNTHYVQKNSASQNILARV